MPSNEEIYTYANMIIEQYKDDCLYYIAEEMACTNDVNEVVFLSQVFRIMTEIQDPSIEFAC